MSCCSWMQHPLYLYIADSFCESFSNSPRRSWTTHDRCNRSYWYRHWQHWDWHRHRQHLARGRVTQAWLEIYLFKCMSPYFVTHSGTESLLANVRTVSLSLSQIVWHCFTLVMLRRHTVRTSNVFGHKTKLNPTLPLSTTPSRWKTQTQPIPPETK